MRQLYSAIRIALAVACIPLGLSAHSLSDALAYAYEHSDLLDQQRFLLRAQDEDVAVATSALRPTIAFFTNATQSETSAAAAGNLTATLGLQVDWTLYSGGANKTRIEAANFAVQAARQGLILAEQQVLLDAVTAFMTLRQDIQTVSLRENNLRLITQELRASEDRFEVGEVTRTDVSIAQARLASARSALAAARGQVEVSRQTYILAVGREPHGLVAPPALPSLPPSVEQATTLALRDHPSIRQLQHTVKANELQALASEQDRRGSVTLSGRVSGTETIGGRNAFDESSSLTLGYTVPLSTGGRLVALSRRAEAVLYASRAQLVQQGRVVSDAVGRAWALLSVQRAQVAASRQQVRAAQLAFDGTREEASLGARTTLDVLNAEQELLDARTSALAAETQAYIAVYNVLFAMGLLTTDHLGLSVERYAPEAYYNVVSDAPRGVHGNWSDLDRILKRVGDD